MSIGLGARQRGRVLFAMASCVALGTLLTLWPTSLTCEVGCGQVCTVMPSRSLGKCDVTVRYGGLFTAHCALLRSFCTHPWLCRRRRGTWALNY